jgi:hypothetical protein
MDTKMIQQLWTEYIGYSILSATLGMVSILMANLTIIDEYLRVASMAVTFLSAVISLIYSVDKYREYKKKK